MQLVEFSMTPQDRIPQDTISVWDWCLIIQHDFACRCYSPVVGFVVSLRFDVHSSPKEVHIDFI